MEDESFYGSISPMDEMNPLGNQESLFMDNHTDLSAVTDVDSPFDPTAGITVQDPLGVELNTTDVFEPLNPEVINQLDKVIDDTEDISAGGNDQPSFKGNSCSAGCAGTCEGSCHAVCANNCSECCKSIYAS